MSDPKKAFVTSSIGVLQLEATENALVAIRFKESKPADAESTVSTNPVLDETVAQIDAFFQGQLTSFDLPLDPQGTEFQQSVWQALCKIPYGQTISYGQLAKRLGDPQKVRAVGSANGKNPIPVIIPCHRVVGADGTLVGYSGGISRKKALLRHEGAILL
jgi:O-6-methylguanine DNA methyltransferase